MNQILVIIHKKPAVQDQIATIFEKYKIDKAKVYIQE